MYSLGIIHILDLVVSYHDVVQGVRGVFADATMCTSW